MQRTSRYDIDKMLDDMAARGLQFVDIATRCQPPTPRSSITRFFSGAHQTPRMAKRIAEAIGFSLRRYALASERRAAA